MCRGTKGYLRALHPLFLSHEAAEEWKGVKFEYSRKGETPKGEKKGLF